MGLFWDLIQQSQISSQQSRAESMEQRVYDLEIQLDDTRRLLNQLVNILEQHFGQDIDGDGRIG